MAPAMPGTKLFVGCLPYSKSEADLTAIFGQFGPISEVVVLKNKGAGFVTYQNPDCASAAVQHLQGFLFEGSTRGINVSFATSHGSPGGGAGAMGGCGASPGYFGGCGHFGGGGGGAYTSGPGAMTAYGKGRAPSGKPSYDPYAVPRGQPPPPPPSHMGRSAGLPGTKLFIGQLPYSKSENDLWQLFGSIGPLTEVVLLRDKETGEKKGAGFVRYQSPQHAAAAVAALHGFLFTGSTRPITVSIAQREDSAASAMPWKRAWSTIESMGKLAGSQQAAAIQGATGGGTPASIPGSKLFLGQLPFSRSEADIAEVFSAYGPILEVVLHRDAMGQKKGGAFVRYATAAHATAALEMDGYIFDGATRPITVQIAGGDGAKRLRAS